MSKFNWTRERDEVLISMRNEGSSEKEIGKVLGISHQAVYARMKVLAQPHLKSLDQLHGKVKDFWTSVFDKQLVLGCFQGKSDGEIAKVIGCSHQAVRARRGVLCQESDDRIVQLVLA